MPVLGGFIVGRADDIGKARLVATVDPPADLRLKPLIKIKMERADALGIDYDTATPPRRCS